MSDIALQDAIIKKRISSRKWREKNREKLREYSRVYRIEHAASISASRKTYNRAYAQSHKEKRNAYSKLYHQTHDQRPALRARYNANKAIILAQNKAYREAHAEDQVARHKAYYASHKQQYKEAWHRRRANIKHATQDAGNAIKDAMTTTKHVCYWCGKRLPKTGWHMDHVIPLSKGGTHTAANLVKSCAKCNSSKGPKLPSEWTGTKQLVML